METAEEIDQQIHEPLIVSSKEILLKNAEKITLPTLHISQMSLYHGSPIPGITEFDLEESDQMTIGRGIYFTPDKNTAREYAKSRSNNTPKATLYEVTLKDADIADLRTDAAQKEFAKLYKESLVDWMQNVLPNLKGHDATTLNMIKEIMQEQFDATIKKIDTQSWTQLRDITSGWEGVVSNTLAAQGYQGLMSREGEPPKIDFHDSVVVFDPKDTPIISQQTV